MAQNRKVADLFNCEFGALFSACFSGFGNRRFTQSCTKHGFKSAGAWLATHDISRTRPGARHILYPPTRPSPDPRCFSTCVGDVGPSHPPRRATNVIVIVVVSTWLFMWFQGYMLASAKTTSHLSSVLVRYLTGPEVGGGRMDGRR